MSFELLEEGNKQKGKDYLSLHEKALDGMPFAWQSE